MARQLADVGSLVTWCAAACESVAFREGVLDRFQTLVPFDGGFFATTDPATLLYTSAVRRNMPESASDAFVRTELGARDVNQLRDLAHAATPVGWLDSATHGDRRSSVRYREAMAPIGLGDELRLALRVDGLCWGLICLHRADAATGFSEAEVETAGRLVPRLAEGLRRSTVIDATVDDSTTDGPGVVLLAPDRSVEAVTPAAFRWIDELRDADTPRTASLPTVIRAVVERLNLRDADRAGPRTPRARVRAPSGRWLTIHASPLAGSELIAIVIEPAPAGEVSPLIVAAYGLTARETEVAQRLIAGLARKAIAVELRVSAHTINDHAKAIFNKTGVSTVGQLRGLVFAEQSSGNARGRTRG